MCSSSHIANAASVTLYDGSAASLPYAQGWLEFSTVPASVSVGSISVSLPQVTETLITGGGGVRIDSEASTTVVSDATDTAGGYGNYESCISSSSCTPNLINASFPTLNRSLGYSIFFNVKINAETHDDTDRAGFSIIVISSDLQGIEIGFWIDKIWAQNGGAADSTLFTQGENASVNTTSLNSYELRVLGDKYQLLQNNVQILTGDLRNYTAFDHTARTMTASIMGVPVSVPVPLPYNPYKTANLVFFGDDTSRAHTNADLTLISVSTNSSSGAVSASLGFAPFLLGILLMFGGVLGVRYWDSVRP